MLKRRNKSVGEDHRYIFMSHHEDGVGQWDFSKRQLLGIVTLCIAIIGSGKKQGSRQKGEEGVGG